MRMQQSVGITRRAGRYGRVLAACLLVAGAARAAAVDPLIVEIDASDALRFAHLLEGEALPTAEQLQRGYLDGAGRGVAIFMPGRIGSSENLARAVAAEPQRYRYAITHCLPLLSALQADLRSVYLAYAGLLQEKPLPAIHVVFGAGNSGGTASACAQVLGLEVMCGPGATPEQFRTAMRGIFAHETVHSWQDEARALAQPDRLLAMALLEGVPDYLASLVTGEVPTPQRDRWARGRERWLWAEFNADRVQQRLPAAASPEGMAETGRRFHRWFGNFRSAPAGWPYEAGYWVGMRIAEAYVATAPDRRRAIRELIEMRDPEAILKASGYAP